MLISAFRVMVASTHAVFESIDDIIHVMCSHVREKRKGQYSGINFFGYGKIAPFILEVIGIKRLKMGGNKMDAGANVSLV